MKITLIKTLRLFFVTCLLSSLMSSISAEDIDIFSNEVPPVPANVLFVFDSSGSMDWSLLGDYKPTGSEKSRLETLRISLSQALDIIAVDPDIPEINIGMMNFSGHGGKWLAHGPAYPVVPLKANASTALNANPLFTHPGTAPTKSYLPIPAATDQSKDYLKKIANTWKAKGKTPLVDALYEAALYMKGQPINWGKKPPNNKRSAHPSTYTGLIGINGTSTTTNVCKYKPCGDGTGVACNATMRNCTTATEAWNWCGLASEAECLAANPTYSRCVAQSYDNCTTPCLARDEAGSCISQGTPQCTTVDYFDCVEPVNTTTCEHEICKDETTTDKTIVGSATYNTPITEECQSSHIVLLSDGAPTANRSSSDVESFIGSSYANSCDSGSDFARCGKELAKYLANTDHRTDLDGEHRIKVHTIGLSLTGNTPESKKAIKNLKEISDEFVGGNGTFSAADTPEQLANSLIDAVNSGLDKSRAFSSPSYSPDPNTLLSHGDEVYLPMFQKGTSSVWSGNLKKFKLLNGQLVDQNNAAATDAMGNMVDKTKDIWSKATDLNSDPVKDGGVAKLLDPNQRKLFSNLGALSSSYANIKSKLGNASMSNAYRDTLLAFIRGKKQDGSNRYHLGDIIHSKPVLVSYGTNGVVFIGTNEGFLHAFDTTTGKEIFAFMPEELLNNIEPQFNTVENGVKSKHLYGVDGKITLWHDDANKNNRVDGSEKVVLYFGLRRGGKSYYALDVSNPSSPQLLWKKASDAHSWSTPKVAKLRYKPNTKSKTVVIYGGGYSDDASGNEVLGKGNAVHIVDALTGATVWSKAVTRAVPAGIRVLDMDQNGSVDRLYFSDTGGNIWRVDLNASNLDNSGDLHNINKAKITKFASLGTAHKFFVEPDVAVFKHKGQHVLSVAIGSGERPNPLDITNDDYFFALFDENVYNLPTASTGTIDITELASAPAINVDLTSSSRTYKGWKMKLNATALKGEKVLSSALTFQNMVMFTSFGIDDTSLQPNDCSQTTKNFSSLYVLDLLTGGATLDLNGDGVVKHPNDITTIIGTGIVETPQVVYGKPKSSTGGVCDPGDCLRSYDIRVGRAVIGFADNQTPTTQLLNTLIPKVYWIDQDK